MGNRLVFVDESTHVGKTLAVYYPMRPSNLVAVLDCAQISNIAGAVVTVGSRPSSWTSADAYDLVQNNKPFDVLSLDQTVSLAGNVFTFSSVPTQLAVGDWVCLASESPIPQVPVEVMNYLCQGVVVKCLEALGDQVAHQIANAKYQKMEKDIINVLTPRTTDQPTKIVNTYNMAHRVDDYTV